MSDTLDNKKKKRDVLQSTMAVVNTLMLYMPQLFGRALVEGAKGKVLDSPMIKRDYRELPATDPLYVKVKKQADKIGIEVGKVLVHKKPKKINAATINLEKDKAVAILISYDPKSHKEGERILDNIIAHELYHVKNNDGLSRARSGAIPLLITLLIASAALKTPKQWKAVPIALGLSAGFGAAVLNTTIARQEEHIADLEGASLTNDPEGMIKVMEMLLTQDEAVRQKIGTIGRLFVNHPSIPDRIAALREEFNLSAGGKSSGARPDSKNDKDDQDNNPGPPDFHIT